MKKKYLSVSNIAKKKRGQIWHPPSSYFKEREKMDEGIINVMINAT